MHLSYFPVLWLFVTLFCYIAAPHRPLSAVEGPLKAKAALSGEPCQTEAHLTWTLQERWVWGQICKGQTADFNSAQEYGGELKSWEPEGWTPERILRPVFLETILLHEPYRSAVPHQGIRIIGGWFKEALYLPNMTLTGELGLERSRFESDVNLTSLRSSYVVSLNGSTFIGELKMDSLHTSSHLFLEGALLAEVALANTRIDGNLSLNGSASNGKLNMNNLEVGGHLFMDGAQLAGVELISARVKGSLSMSKSQFKGGLDMNSLNVDGHLIMDGGQFAVDGPLVMDEAEVDAVSLSNTRVKGQLSLSGSMSNGKLNMNNLEVGGHLFMDGAQLVEVALITARIRGTFSIADRAKIRGKFNMDSLEVGGHFLLKAQFAEVDLRSAHIKGHLDMDRSTFIGRLTMDSLDVTASLFMREAQFAEVDLRSARIGGQLSMSESLFTAPVTMESILVSRELLVHGATFFNYAWRMQIELAFAKIGSNLDFSGSQLSSLDLTGAEVGGLFQLGPRDKPPKWLPEARLTLRNARVGVLQDLQEAWPSQLVLDGFNYSLLGGDLVERTNDKSIREVSWYTGCRGKQTNYSPQPYEQLASVLEKGGYKDEAREIRYASKECERSQATGLDRAWLTGLQWAIGYGYRYQYTVIWTLCWIACGAAVLYVSWWSKLHPSNRWPDDRRGIIYNIITSIFFSFDMLLPIISLNPQHELEIFGEKDNPDNDYHPFVILYFYIHQTAGYVLAFFLAAGLAGLTK